MSTLKKILTLAPKETLRLPHSALILLHPFPTPSPAIIILLPRRTMSFFQSKAFLRSLRVLGMLRRPDSTFFFFCDSICSSFLSPRLLMFTHQSPHLFDPITATSAQVSSSPWPSVSSPSSSSSTPLSSSHHLNSSLLSTCASLPFSRSLGS